jgi:NAD(P)-dependent dehydrogenase (short-subunit alcohol dehydrogenase family)
VSDYTSEISFTPLSPHLYLSPSNLSFFPSSFNPNIIMSTPSLDLGFQNQHVLVTGGSGLIGRVVVSHFLAAGANVSSLDITHTLTSPTPRQTNIYCDVGMEDNVRQSFEYAAQVYGPVSICVALASLDLSVLSPSSFADASFSQLKNVLEVNVCGTWLTAREWVRGLKNLEVEAAPEGFNPCLIIIGSESGHFGERSNAEYSLAKSAVQGGLLMSLRAEVPHVWRGARVNVVAPGPVETQRWAKECAERLGQWWEEAQATVSQSKIGVETRRGADNYQTALGEPIPVKAVAMSILATASHNFSSHVHGQVINVDGGKQGKIMWSEEEGRELRERSGN